MVAKCISRALISWWYRLLRNIMDNRFVMVGMLLKRHYALNMMWSETKDKTGKSSFGSYHFYKKVTVFKLRFTRVLLHVYTPFYQALPSYLTDISYIRQLDGVVASM